MLYKNLIDNSKSDIYPFHMPGHKRQNIAGINPYEIDITEIDGFDNLHDSEGILKEAQDRAARLYGAKKTYYLINGSTCGILSAISASTKKHDKVLVARNCHKAVYHSIYLRELSPVYIYPEITSQGIQGQIKESEIKKCLEEDPDIKAVIITSPTYDGIVSDIRSIAEVVHEKNIPLIVDEAHGAHFGFSKGMPENAVKLGADAVIVSVHKTLPAFTQTALLHICSDRISQSKIEKFLVIYETSSPSYILMAGIDRCINEIDKNRESLFNKLEQNLSDFYDKVKDLNNLKVLLKKDLKKTEAYDFDESKIIVFTRKTSISGKKLSNLLLNKYNIQVEMVAENYILALSSVMDTKEGFDRLARALIEIDSELENTDDKVDSYNIEEKSFYTVQEKVLEIYEVEDYEEKKIDLSDANGQISASYINLYPPGIPIIVPGEKITDKLIQDIKHALELKLDLQGLGEDGSIKVIAHAYEQ